MYITVLKWIAPVLIILLALLAGEIHGRSVIRLQDAKANAFMAVQAQQARDKADAAQKQSQGAQARFNDYLGSHPIEPIRVCVTRPISVHVPAVVAGAESTGPGPAPGAEVPVGSSEPGPDIGPELGTIVQGFARLAITVAEFQAR